MQNKGEYYNALVQAGRVKLSDYIKWLEDGTKPFIETPEEVERKWKELVEKNMSKSGVMWSPSQEMEDVLLYDLNTVPGGLTLEQVVDIFKSEKIVLWSSSRRGSEPKVIQLPKKVELKEKQK